MKEFILKIVNHIFISFLLVNILIFTFLKLYPEYFITDFRDYVVLTNQYRRIQTSQKNNKVIIGDSRANVAFNTALINHRFNNLAIPGSTFIEGFFTIRKLLENSQIDTVICCYGNSYLESNGWFDRRTLKMGQNLMSFSDLIEIQQLHKDSDRLNYLRNSVERILIYLRFPYLYRSNFFSNFLKIFENKNSKSILEKIKFSEGNYYFEQRSESQIIENKKDIKKHNKINFHPVVEHYKNKLVELCRKEKIVLIFVFPPTFSEIELSGQNYFKEKLQKNGFTVVQFPIFSAHLFSDQTHLNEKGSFEFMTMFSNGINAL